MTREEKLQKAHQMFDNRNLLTELKWQREYFKSGYVNSQEELFNLWIFDECIKVLEHEPTRSTGIMLLDEYIKRKENRTLDKIRTEISCNIIDDDTSGNTPAKLRADWVAANKAHMIDIAIIDKYKTGSVTQ